MFGQTQPTPFDLNFSILGIPVRVHPVFWLTSGFLSWGAAVGWAGNEGHLPFLVVGVLCVFVSILVHELGHAVVTRAFGWSPVIVLEFFGGYATSMRHSTWKDIAVSAAGPAAGFLLFFIAFGLSVLSVAGAGGDLLQHRLVRFALSFLVFINLLWNILNLIPVHPLDGGQICRELCLWLSPRNGMQTALLISMLVAGGVTLFAARCVAQRIGFFGLDPLFVAIMFGYLSYQSFLGWEQAKRGYW